MSVAECVKRFLALDITDGDPAVVSTRNSSIWATSGDVAPYAYRSLGFLWIGTGTSTPQLLNRNQLGIWRRKYSRRR